MTDEVLNREASTDSLYSSDALNQGDYAGSWHQEPVGFVSAYVHALMTSAADHLLALVQVLHRLAPLFLLSTLSRVGVQKLLGGFFWLADDCVDLRTRVARVMTELLYSNHEQKKLLRPHGGANQITIPEDTIISDANKLGLDIVGKNRLSVDKGREPSTHIVAEAVGQELGTFIYQVLSAGVHGTAWSILSRMAVRLSPGEAEAGTTDGVLATGALAVESASKVYVVATKTIGGGGNWTEQRRRSMPKLACRGCASWWRQLKTRRFEYLQHGPPEVSMWLV